MLFTPYLVFVLQVLGFTIAVWLIAKAVPGSIKGKAAPAVIVGSFLTVLFMVQIWESAGKVEAVRESLNPPTGLDGFSRCLADGGKQKEIPFVLWLKGHVGLEDSITFKGHSQIDFACLQLALHPRKVVAPSESAKWVAWLENAPNSLRQRSLTERELPLAQRKVSIFASDQILVRER